MNILEVKNLCVKYNEHYALKNVSFNVKEKEYVCLVGKNGSGKSTLLKTISGLIKKDSGSIEFKIDKSDVSYLAQNNMTDINFPATAKEIILTGVQKHGIKPFYSKKDEIELEKVTKNLKISDLLNKKIGDLSGGQRQRVLLARTLIGNPKVLLLDEPCSGLDISTIKNFYAILDDLYKNTDITIIMATHDLEAIKNENIRIIALEQKVVFDGNIKKYEVGE
ncbi:MAG: ATP-binding cassette domain-containing protein [Clostridia bacterium]|jgi:zinc transport system ATP-binding protein|nr:ATP-binding cassette domain-containing protein [Clostridia bacterium]